MCINPPLQRNWATRGATRRDRYVQLQRVTMFMKYAAIMAMYILLQGSAKRHFCSDEVMNSEWKWCGNRHCKQVM